MRMLLGVVVLAVGVGWSQDVPAKKQGLDDASAQAAGAGKGRVGETALDVPIANRDGDASALASPVAAGRAGTSIRVGTAIQMTVAQAVSSGVQINGDKVHGTLSAAVRTTSGMVLPVGTAVDATVVSSAKAGMIASGGVLSLQLTRVGGVPVITDVADFNGPEGHKDVADSAPAKGGEAMVQAGAPLTFHVMQEGKATGVAPAKVGGQPGGAGVLGSGSSVVGDRPAGGATQGVVPGGSTPK